MFNQGVFKSSSFNLGPNRTIQMARMKPAMGGRVSAAIVFTVLGLSALGKAWALTFEPAHSAQIQKDFNGGESLLWGLAHGHIRQQLVLGELHQPRLSRHDPCPGALHRPTGRPLALEPREPCLVVDQV